jgi:Dynamin family
MGRSSLASSFSIDVLRVKISGLDRPHLTIVDLSGLIRSENKLLDLPQMCRLFFHRCSLMADRRSIILAVVSAKKDYTSQIVTKLAKDGHLIEPQISVIYMNDTISGRRLLAIVQSCHKKSESSWKEVKQHG